MLNFGGILPIKLFDTIVLNPPIFTFTPFSAPNSKLKNQKNPFWLVTHIFHHFLGYFGTKNDESEVFFIHKSPKRENSLHIVFFDHCTIFRYFGFCISVSSETIVSSDSVTGVLVTESTPSANLLPTPALVPVYRICSIPSSGVDLPWWQQQPHVR